VQSQIGPILPPSLTSDLNFGSGGIHAVGTGGIFTSSINDKRVNLNVKVYQIEGEKSGEGDDDDSWK